MYIIRFNSTTNKKADHMTHLNISKQQSELLQSIDSNSTSTKHPMLYTDNSFYTSLNMPTLFYIGGVLVLAEFIDHITL